ncbi:MAG: sigma 54-interacting transcriptional regulator [Verrucomicrobia bacterium]|nr:sigma 54-interacting transcriptional regulator [Verrucomicrobiota bacterium]MDA1086171.1 sigma 54-interacting transcriptional regulator [Verrucomicrobiota bacterium]
MLDLDTIVGPYDLYDSVVAFSPHMRNVCETVESILALDGPVLLVGEKGCGKAMLAHQIHDRGPRQHEDVIVLDCKQASDTVFEELGFIFDGSDDLRAAVKKHFPTTKVTRAGSVILEDVECLPSGIEGRLLYAIQHQKSGTKRHRTAEPHPRIIATTTHSHAAIRDGNLIHKALYEDLAQLAITIKPLRERREDILPLIHHILRERAKDGDIEPAPTLALDVAYTLEEYAWPGNCGELKDVILQALSAAPDHRIRREHLPDHRFPPVALSEKVWEERIRSDFLVGESANAMVASMY